MLRKIANFACLTRLLFAVSLTYAVPAQAEKTITLNSFKSSSLWPIWAADRQGLFAKEGLAIKNVYTATSTAQMVGLIKGEFEW